MPLRRYRSSSNKYELSSAFINLALTSGTGNNDGVYQGAIIESIDTSGVRKVKNIEGNLVIKPDANNNINIIDFLVLVYYHPANSNPLFGFQVSVDQVTSCADVMGDNSAVITANICHIQSDSGYGTVHFRTPLSRLLNKGDSIWLAVLPLYNSGLASIPANTIWTIGGNVTYSICFR